MNHNNPRFYVFFVNHRNELQAHGRLEGFTNYSEAIMDAELIRRPSIHREPPVVYIFKATPLWRFDDDTPQGKRVQEDR